MEQVKTESEKGLKPFVADAELTAISMVCRDRDLIATEVAPYSPVGSREFECKKSGKDAINRWKNKKSKPEFTTEKTSTIDLFERGDLSPDKIATVSLGFHPVEEKVELLTHRNLVALEKRVADMAFNPDNFAENNKITLSGESLFSHPSSKPVAVFKAAIAASAFKPNFCVIGRGVWTFLEKHPEICHEVFGTRDNRRVITPKQFAGLFGFDKVLIGSGFANISEPGQKPELVHLWGNSVLLFYCDPLAAIEGKNPPLTFALTARYGDRVAGKRENEETGSVEVWQGESVRELLIAPDFGYLISSAV